MKNNFLENSVSPDFQSLLTIEYMMKTLFEIENLPQKSTGTNFDDVRHSTPTKQSKNFTCSLDISSCSSIGNVKRKQKRLWLRQCQIEA